MEIKKRLIQSVVAIGLAATLALPVFAQTDGTMNTNTTTNVNTSTNTDHGSKDQMKADRQAMLEKQKEERKAMMDKQKADRQAMKDKMMQERAAQMQAAASCLKAAAGKRDDAVIAAWGTLNTSVMSALTGRKAALQAAWDLTDATARRDALRAAWKAYADAARAARKAFSAGRLAAWTQFRTDRKACGPAASSLDQSSNQSDAGL